MILQKLKHDSNKSNGFNLKLPIKKKSKINIENTIRA